MVERVDCREVQMLGSEDLPEIPVGYMATPENKTHAPKTKHANLKGPTCVECDNGNIQLRCPMHGGHYGPIECMPLKSRENSLNSLVCSPFVL